MRIRRPAVVALAVLLLPAAVLVALRPLALGAQFRGLTTIGSVAEDRLRLRQLADSAPTAGFLIRSARTLSAPGDRARHAFVALPEVDVRWNDRVPLALNDGAMWSGRGANALVRAGAYFSNRWLSIVLAPEVTVSRNLGFEVFPGREPGRSAWSSPWHTGGHSADLPLRFGDRALTLTSPGQSSLTIEAGPIAAGASSENQWWGPGVRNALLLSTQAAGVPHLFVRSARPLRSRAGDVEFRAIAGGLTESIFFDTIPSNDFRSLSGVIVTLTPRAAPHLTVGVARLVVAPARAKGSVLAGALNAFTRWRPACDPRTRADSLAGDQLTSLFGRWIFPKDRFELWFEWAKSELPRSLRELIIAPQNAQGYTLGFQWALPARGSRATVRVQAEATNVEQSVVFAERPPADFYTGRAAPQGFTQRGQLLGASVGPGGQGQWLAADYLVPGWSLGLMLQRIRWEDGALYREPIPNFFRHDVTLLAGLRGTLRTGAYDYSASIATNRRLNYLFQNGIANPAGRRTVDVPNLTLTLSASPR